MPKFIWIFFIAVLLGAGWYLYQNRSVVEGPIVGGERDSHGCLGPAGFSYNEEIGACARSFDLTDDIAHAARVAVEKTGKAYALTVSLFNSYEDGTYDITLERGIERLQQVVNVATKDATFACEFNKTITARFYPGLDTSVDLTLSDGRRLYLPHALSASGARYADADETMVFWNKGDSAFITEKGIETYSKCVIK